MSARFHPVTGVSVPWGSRQICEQKKAPDLSSRANRNRRHLIEPLVVRAVAAAFAARVVPARVAGATSRLAAARLAGGRGLRVSPLLRDDIARELVRLAGFGFGFGLGLGLGLGLGFRLGSLPRGAPVLAAGSGARSARRCARVPRREGIAAAAHTWLGLGLGLAKP